MLRTSAVGLVAIGILGVTIGATFPKSFCVTLNPGDPRRSAACSPSGCVPTSSYCDTIAQASYTATPGAYDSCQASYGAYSCEELTTKKACIMKTYYPFPACLGAPCNVEILQPDCRTILP